MIKKKIFLTKKQPSPPISSQEKQSRRGLTGQLQVTVAVLLWFSVAQCLPQCLIGAFLLKLPPPRFPLRHHSPAHAAPSLALGVAKFCRKRRCVDIIHQACERADGHTWHQFERTVGVCRT